MDNKFETEVLTRLAVIESKLDGYKEIKRITYLNEQKCSNNESDIVELKSHMNEIETRIDEIEKKPTKRYDSIVGQIISFVVEVVLILVAIKIGLK